MSARLDTGTAADVAAPSRVRLRPGVSRRAALGLLAGLALGLLLLAVAARGVSLDQAWSALTHARPLWVALALLSVLLTTGAKVARWRGLFDQTRRPGIAHLGLALLAGKMANALLPARAGDVLRIYLASERGQARKATVLGTVAAEKAFDVLLMLLCGCLAAASVSLPAWLNYPLLAGAAGGFLFLVLALAWPQGRIAAWVERRAQGLPRGLPQELGGWLANFTQRALSGLAALRKPRMALRACAWSVAAWALAAGTNYALFCAFDLRLSAGSAVFLLVVLYAGVTPPSLPGRLGVFHALTLLTLEVLGVEQALGLAYATVLHAIVYAVEIVPGAILLAVHLAARRKG